MNHASGAVTPPDAEVIQVGDAIFFVQSLSLCSHRRHIGSCLAVRTRAVAVIFRGEGMFSGGSR